MKSSLRAPPAKGLTGGRPIPLIVGCLIFLISFVLIPAPAAALNADRFLVLNDAGCTPTLISTTAGCWAATSGGAGGAGVPGTTDRALLDGNSGAGAGNLNADLSVKDWCMSAACNGGTSFAGTLNAITYTIHVARHWNSNSSGVGFVRGTSTVSMEGIGTLTTKNDGSYGYKDLYNMVVAVGATTTFTTLVGVANQLTVNGALVSAGGDAERVFSVFGVSGTANPVVLGGSGNLASSGFLYYSVESTSDFNVVGTTYQHLGVRGAPGITANIAGDIHMGNCGNSLDCGMLINAIVPGTRFTVRTNNHDLTMGGTFFVGDGSLFPVTFYAGSSRIEAGGINPTGPGFSYWGTSTMIAHVSPDTCDGIVFPYCLSFYEAFGAVAYLQNASFTASDAELHLFDGTTLYANATAINFKRLTVAPTGHLFKDGFDVSNLQMTASVGFATIPTWTAFSRPTRAAWQMSFSNPGATFEIYLGNMTIGASYWLLTNGDRSGTATADGIGTVHFISTPGAGLKSFEVTNPAGLESSILSQAMGWFWIFLFFIAMAAIVVGAYRFRRWRDSE